MKKVILKTNDRNIPIFIGEKIVNRTNLHKYINHKDIVIITNSKIAKIHLNNLRKILKKYNVQSYILPDGEKYKNLNSLNKIHNFLISNKYNRDVTIIALGGGVIGDLAAFAADTFLRGVDLIHIPTTLLAQVDSSIGGKSGINHDFGKNLIGSFKHPKAVFVDIEYLKTLPIKEFISGLAEVIKYGVISNNIFLKWLNKNTEKILNKDSRSLIKIITTSIKEKVTIVEKDEKESNIRAYLNFGHTLGHAIESSKNYKGILHGEAISIGMLFASAISVEKSALTIDEFNLIEDTLRNFRLPISIPRSIKTTKIIQHMAFDKKNKDGKNNFVLLKSIGSCHIYNALKASYISSLVKTFQS